jgi:iron complex outermembrane receptor protein
MSRKLLAVLVGTAAAGLAVTPLLAQTASPSPQASPAPAAAASPGGQTGGATLPPVVVEQPAAAVTAAPPKPQAPKAAAAPPAPPPPRKQAPKAAKVAPTPTLPPASESTANATPDASLPANPGTPSAGTRPILGIAGNPGGQTVTSIDRERVKNDPVFSVSDLLKETPGVSVKQGNGPRDIGISIRGSNARNGFGVRNIVVMEDGFPVTQPDGLSRTDLTDPHAYGAVDVWRGPSSALFGNYATGGAINFRTRTGGEINGAEVGADYGSFGYLNHYTTVGGKAGGWEAALFASDVRGDGHFEYSSFDTQTVNFLLTGQITPKDKITLKVIDNELHTELPFRYSLNQFYANPFQKGCLTAAGAAAGCQTAFFSRTGNTGTAANPGLDRVNQTAAQSGANRDDRRTIVGTRWEHQLDDATSWRIQYVFDDRNISQPTSATSAVGDYLSHNVMADLTHRHGILGREAIYTIAGYWNVLPVHGYTWNVAPGDGTPLGLLAQEQTGYTQNIGARLREEIKLDGNLTVVGGINVESTHLHGMQTAYRYRTTGALQSQTSVGTDRTMTNNAEELSLLWRPSSAWQLRGRVATAYGTPQFSNLFVLPDGSSGNNTSLQAQTNVGVDLGADWTPAPGVLVSVTGFQEWFRNEIVSQATPPGSVNGSYSFNAPASEHRGFEVAIDLRPIDGWRLTSSYLFNDQYYTDYTERLNNGATTRLLDRSGNKIPGIAPHEITTRLGYDQPLGILKGLGAYVEHQWRDAFSMDNGNYLQAPGAKVVNVNVHYNTEFQGGFVKAASAFFEVKNVFDTTYIAAANNIGNSITAAGAENGAAVLANTSNSIYAGAPRAFFGGVKLKF